MINIGTIKGTHNLRGSVKITTGFSHIIDLIDAKVLAENKLGAEILTIKNIKQMTDKKYIIDFYEINNIDKAKTLIGASIKIRKDLLDEIDEDNYNNDDLIGYEVINNNETIGNVTDILETAAHDILVINNNNKEILIPFVEDVFVTDINFEEKKIFVNLLEGMI